MKHRKVSKYETDCRLECNESKKSKAAKAKTLSSHGKWFRERKFRGNITSLNFS